MFSNKSINWLLSCGTTAGSDLLSIVSETMRLIGKRIVHKAFVQMEWSDELHASDPIVPGEVAELRSWRRLYGEHANHLLLSGVEQQLPVAYPIVYLISEKCN
jgi:hypothetical protein